MISLLCQNYILLFSLKLFETVIYPLTRPMGRRMIPFLYYDLFRTCAKNLRFFMKQELFENRDGLDM